MEIVKQGNKNKEKYLEERRKARKAVYHTKYHEKETDLQIFVEEMIGKVNC